MGCMQLCSNTHQHTSRSMLLGSQAASDASKGRQAVLAMVVSLGKDTANASQGAVNQGARNARRTFRPYTNFSVFYNDTGAVHYLLRSMGVLPTMNARFAKTLQNWLNSDASPGMLPIRTHACKRHSSLPVWNVMRERCSHQRAGLDLGGPGRRCSGSCSGSGHEPECRRTGC